MNNCEKVFELIKKPEETINSRLFSPWSQKLFSMSRAANELLHLDEQLVKPKEMHQPVVRSLHWEHTGWDAIQ